MQHRNLASQPPGNCSASPGGDVMKLLHRSRKELRFATNISSPFSVHPLSSTQNHCSQPHRAPKRPDYFSSMHDGRSTSMAAPFCRYSRVFRHCMMHPGQLSPSCRASRLCLGAEWHMSGLSPCLSGTAELLDCRRRMTGRRFFPRCYGVHVASSANVDLPSRHKK